MRVRVPWIVRAILSIPLTLGLWVWRLALLLHHGPGYFCWQGGCWERSWYVCHGSSTNGNGAMCRKHCKESSYHGRFTGCGEASQTVVTMASRWGGT